MEGEGRHDEYYGTPKTTSSLLSGGFDSTNIFKCETMGYDSQPVCDHDGYSLVPSDELAVQTLEG